jgi:hypothetical protein
MIDDLKNEERIATTDSNRLVLTNRRIIYKSNQDYKSMRLENITYMELSKRPVTAILYVTVLVNILLPMFFSSDQDGLEGAFRLAGGVMIFGLTAFYLFKRKKLVFATSGGSIQLKVGHMSNDECYRFIEFTEHAIHTMKSHSVSPVMHT